MTKEADPKIIDLLQQMKEGDKPFVSLEFFPPRTEEGVKSLYARMDRMKLTLDPLFTDVTWGAGGSTASLSLEIAKQAHDRGHVANLHMTCTNMVDSPLNNPREGIRQAVTSALQLGITNLVALRGDPPAGQETWTAVEGGFTCALDLVTFLRTEFPSTTTTSLGISVAGYPEGHPNAISKIDDPSTLTPTEAARSSNFDGITYTCLDADYEKELAYLKRKVDAGADFIITQMFFDPAVYTQFVLDCRRVGITCPIVPGIMCLNAYAGFRKMSQFCKSRVPPTLESSMQELQTADDNTFKQFGMEYGASMCRTLIDFGVPALHFYTLNLEKVVYGILERIGYLESKTLSSSVNSNSTTTTIVPDDGDASIMQAVGSAWARVGDTVTSIFGRGIVMELRSSGAAMIQIKSWELAGGQHPTAYLEKEHYQKVF